MTVMIPTAINASCCSQDREKEGRKEGSKDNEDGTGAFSRVYLFTFETAICTATDLYSACLFTAK